MAIDLSGFDEVVDEPKALDLSGFDEVVDEPRALDLSGFDAADSVQSSALDLSGFDEEEGPSAGDIVKGVGVEVGAGVGGSVIGGIIGGTLGSVIPGAGTAAGAVIGASLGGATASFFGSLLAQDIEGQEDKSMGRAIAAAFIGAVPGGVGKGIKGGMTLGKVATREAAKGAAFGVTDATARAVIDEGRLPTPGELAQFGGAGALFGGALGGVTTKIGQKFAGKTPQQIDDAIAREEITFKDLSFFPKDIPNTKKTPPPLPETRGGNVQYHGTSKPITKFGEYYDNYSSNNIYGQGFYTTDAMDIARGYTAKGLGQDAVIYKIEETQPVNFLDINKVTAKELSEISGTNNLNEVLDGLDDLPESASGSDLYDWLRLNVDAPKDEIQEIFSIIQDNLMGKGYGGIKHIGGLKTNNAPHNVKIYFDAKNQLRTEESMRFDVPELVQLNKRLKQLIIERRDLPYDGSQDLKWMNERVAVGKRIAELEKPKPTMEGIVLRGIQETKDGARSRAAAQALTQPQANLGTMGKILASVAPSKFVGTKAQQATIDFSRIIKTAEEISGRIGAKTARAIKKDPLLEAPINKFLDTGEMSDDVARVLGPDLTKYNKARVALQKEAIQLIDDGAYKSLDNEARKKLRDTIDDSMNSSQLYARREYKAFLDPNYKPSGKQEQAARNELINAFIAQGDDNATAFAKANKRIDDLKDGFASTKKEDPRKFFGSSVDSVFKKKKNPGEAERIWLGEVRDPVERMRGTLTGVAKSVARERTNVILGKELLDAGIASTSKVDDDMVEIVLRGTGQEGSGLYAYPQVQTALNELYVGNGSEKMDNIFLNGLQDLYRAGVGLSKGVKVLLNTVAYPVQVYGNTANLLGMGINPFNKAGRGLRLALADVPLISRALEGLENTPKARKALLDELEDMAKYGIKNANILESDIRSTLDSGPFSKWLQKGLDPFGKAYQTADTMGRYVGWKANQNTIEKIFPGVSDEAKKKMAAMMINDTYQNYDKLSNVVRTLSRWGVMPQFASFTAEFARNQYNQGKMIARMLAGNFGQEFSTELGEANVKQMRSIGIKRLASLLGVYGATYAGIEGVKAASGVDDKKEEALRDVVYAPWDKNRNQLVKLDKGGRTGWVANPSYVVPHALGLSALQAGLNGDSEQSVIGLMAEELVGDGSFIFQEAYQALANRDERGELISEQVDELDQARERLTFFLTESFRPGFSRELKKIQKARLGKGDLTLKEAGARQLGARINPFDVGEAATFTVRNTNTLSNKAKSRYNSLLKFGDSSEAELNEVYNRSNEIYSDAFVALSKNNKSLSELGYNENERIKIFKDGGISSKRILEILTNSPSDLPRTSKQSTSEIYNEQGETMQQKRSNIMKSMRTDPQTGKRLMSMWVREKRNASKGLNQRDMLMRYMDADEKVDYLSKNPGMINEFKRKNMLSNEVLRALRIKGAM